ncbi:MAG TPA: hypothetical protein VK395_32360 [Gemmataceae bacterium]|nr:hypothetical protein [Gemmataceae bacterium]
MKLKINFKDFDFKQFMLRYGEWVGLGVAGIIALPVLFSGLTKAVGSGSPTANAGDISKLASGVQTSINQATPPKEADQPPPEAFTELKKAHIYSGDFSTDIPWFVPSTIEDSKRRMPEVLSPVEFKLAVVRADIPEIMLVEDAEGNTIAVYTIKNKEIQLPPRLRRKRQVLSTPGAFGGGGGLGGKAGMGGSGSMGGGRMGEGTGPGAPGGMAGAGKGMGPGGFGGRGQQGVPSINEIVRMDIDRLDRNLDAVYAETIEPVHMVIIAGTFPIREQLEKFRKALHKRTLRDLYDMFGSGEAYLRFVGVEVERQVWKNGKVVEEWAPFTEIMTKAMKDLRKRASGLADEPESLQTFDGFLHHGLVMTRPLLYRGSYPEIEMQLDGIRKSLEDLTKEKVDPAKKELSGFARKLQGKDIDLWDPFGDPAQSAAPMNRGAPSPNGDTPAPVNMGGKEMPTPGLMAKKGMNLSRPGEVNPMSSDSPVVVTDMALIRLIDPTVEPGKGYQYRVKVKMVNPNYLQHNTVNSAVAKQKEIIAREWTVIKEIAEVPPDSYWYAIDDRHDQERTTVQVHRWLGTLSTDPNTRATLPVASWSILEKTAAFRGEYLGRTANVRVPVWRTEQAKYMLAKNPREMRNPAPSVPVDFTVRDAPNLDPELLIHFEGGKDMKLPLNKARPVVENLPVQLLVLSSDGKLMVRSTEQDMADGEREKRLKDWKEWVSEVARGGNKTTADQQLFDKRGGGTGAGAGAGGGSAR